MNPLRTGAGGGGSLSEPEVARIREYLDELLASGLFGGSARKAQLLRYLVDHALTGHEVNEYAIGLDVFEKPRSFDPRIDSAVRAEVSRARQKLKDYYAGPGRADRVIIDLPQRSYAPTFTFRDKDEAPPAPKEPPPDLPRNRHWTATTVVMILVAGLATFALWKRKAASPPIESLAVLPFANLSADSQNEYLADGLTEDLTTDLAQLPEFRVVARTSSFQFKGKSIDIREIGQRLNVDALLEGSLEKQGDRIRVTAQLIRASNGYHLWSKAFEARSADMMSLQNELAQAISTAIGNLGPKSAHPASSTVSRSTTNAKAHDLYLQANYEFSRLDRDSIAKSLALFQEAADLDPTYVAAYRGIARAEKALIHLTVEAPRPGFLRIHQALEKALEISPRDAETLGQMADADYIYDQDWPRAEREFRLAVEQQGAQATTRSYYGWSLATRGRFNEAHAQLQIAQDLDPLGAGPRFNQAIAFMLEGRFPEAINLLKNLAELESAHIILGVISVYRRDCAEAARQFDFLPETSAPVKMVGRALTAACRGDNDAARKDLENAAASKSFVSPYQLAMGYAAIGDAPRAVAYLNQSADAREGQIFYIKLDPAFDTIRSDSGFQSLEKKIGLDQ